MTGTRPSPNAAECEATSYVGVRRAIGRTLPGSANVE